MESASPEQQFAITMASAVFGAVLLGNVVTLIADWVMQIGTPNMAGVVAAVIGGISAGFAAIRHLTQDNSDREGDQN